MGFDILPPQSMTLAAAQALCETTPACAAIGYAGDPSPAGPVAVSFKHKVFWSPSSSSGSSGSSSNNSSSSSSSSSNNNSSVWVLNRGYLPGGDNLYTADVEAFGLSSDVDALLAS